MAGSYRVAATRYRPASGSLPRLRVEEAEAMAQTVASVRQEARNRFDPLPLIILLQRLILMDDP